MNVSKINEKQKFSKLLWDSIEIQNLVKESLNTKVVNGIKNGNLDPNLFLIFTIQDIYFIKTISTLISDHFFKFSTNFSEFASLLSKEYMDFVTKKLNNYHLKIDFLNSISLIDSINAYINYIKNLLCERCDIYILIAIYPCLKLYNCIAIRLREIGNENNLYEDWIVENLENSFLLSLEKIIDDYPIEKIDKQLSFEIIKNILNHEIDFFNLR
jgi:thiaminase